MAEERHIKPLHISPKDIVQSKFASLYILFMK